MLNVKRNGYCGNQHYKQEETQFVTFPDIAEAFTDKQIIDRKVEGEQQDKYSNDNFNCGIAISSYTEVPGRKTTGAGRRKSVDDAVIKG